MAEVLRAVVGATFQEPLSFTDRDGAPIDLSGASLRFMAKGRIDDPDGDAVLLATSSGGTLVIEDAAAGRARFAIPAVTMAGLEPSTLLVWTVEIEAGAGTVTRYPDAFQDAPGKLIVAPSVIEALP